MNAMTTKALRRDDFVVVHPNGTGCSYGIVVQIGDMTLDVA